jgi:hypothetical protein
MSLIPGLPPEIAHTDAFEEVQRFVRAALGT